MRPDSSPNNNASQGLIGETVIFDRALTPDETAAVNAYLKTKWFQAFDASTLPAALELGAAATLDLQGEAVTFGTIADAGARKVKIAAVADENGVTTYIGTVVGKGLVIVLR